MSFSDVTERKKWYAVYCVVRHEKVIHDSLIEKGISTFLPLRNVVNRWSDRKKKLQIPLFPGYLFVNTDLKDRLDILKTKGVVRIVGFSGIPHPIPDEQIENIKKLISSKVSFDPYKYFCKGREVVVINGPLVNAKGKIIERRGNYKLILSIDLIQSAVSVEIDIDDVELV